MFASRMAKTQTEPAARSAGLRVQRRPAPAGHRPGHDPAEQVPGRAAPPLHMPGRQAAPANVPRDLSKVPVFPPDRADSYGRGDGLPDHGGQPLGPAARRYFEPRFGHDFSQVRIYSDASAARSASALGARAYTVGEAIVFNDAEYALERPSGQHLLAHELAHVVQQRRGGAHAPVADDPGLDAAAQNAADEIMRGRSVAVTGAAVIGIARQPQAQGAGGAGGQPVGDAVRPSVEALLKAFAAG